jgi:MFS transporter, FHS family, glucose/mannose:H+ symporter
MPVMNSKASLPILHFAFLLTGVATVMMGILLPTVLVKWSITDAQAGSLFVAQFSAAFVGSLLYGEIVLRLGQIKTVITGMAVIALGIGGVALSRWPMLLMFVALYGFGLGFTLPSINLAVASACSDRRSPALNLLNFSWTLGAVSAPLVFGYLLQWLRVSLSTVFLGLAALFLGSGMTVYLVPPPRSSDVDREAVPEARPSNPGTWVLTGLLLFLYVGAETGVAGWTPLMGLRHQILSTSSVSLAQTFFWGSLLAGRLAAGSLWRKAPPRRLISVSLATATSGIVLLATSMSKLGLFSGMVLAGAGLAAVFPTTVAVFSAQATTSAKRAAGMVFAAAGLGGAALPSFIGWMSARGYGLRLGLWLMAFVTMVMFVMEQRIATGRPQQTVV